MVKIIIKTQNELDLLHQVKQNESVTIEFDGDIF